MKTKLIALTCRGSASVDPRFSASMLPWTIADICTRDSFEKLSVGIDNGVLETYNCDFELQFAKKKRRKYQSIINQNYQFLAFAVETMGPWSEEALNFANKLGDLLISETGEARAKLFFMQNISIAIQRGNAASVMGTFPSGANLDEIFYLI